MAMSTQSIPGNGATEAYKTQIESLKSDPNANPAFKQQLDAWLGQLEAAAGGQPTDSGSTPPPQFATPPSADGGNRAVPGPTPDGQSKFSEGANAPAPNGVSGALEPSQNPPLSKVPDDGVSSGKTVNVSGSDKTVSMSNKSDEDMVLYHTGGNGGTTQAIATLKPGETVDVTVGNGTNGAFTKGDAGGDFTSNSGRVEYSVTQDGKVSANLGSECGVHAMSLQAGPYSKKVDDPTGGAPANLKDSSGQLLEPKSNSEVQAYLDSVPDYGNNSYIRWNSDTQTKVMEAAMLDVDKISASFD